MERLIAHLLDANEEESIILASVLWEGVGKIGDRIQVKRGYYELSDIHNILEIRVYAYNHYGWNISWKGSNGQWYTHKLNYGTAGVMPSQ